MSSPHLNAEKLAVEENVGVIRRRYQIERIRSTTKKKSSFLSLKLWNRKISNPTRQEVEDCWTIKKSQGTENSGQDKTNNLHKKGRSLK